ncbi:hypothetical protein BCV70DRAFT_197599 [Testicularia cyperi]|uniref:Vacuolar membrane protein n=1 Tax=Testicularia cyperi TaxID=1882483 RepID=A0A317Y004_9BASI|nr:hypothetical protein BCV70DRAFT_197599 [Testicularia cyperi]
MPDSAATHLDTLANVARDLLTHQLASAASPTADTQYDHVPIPTPTPVLGAPEVDGDNCKLLGPFALVVQAVMGILVIGSLIYKRQHEHPMRKWKIWALDVSKQLLGQLFVHILNVVLSDFVARGGGENPCSLYFLNILVDTTLGVFFIYLGLRYITHFFTNVLGKDGFVSGQYSPPTPNASRSSNGTGASNSHSDSASSNAAYGGRRARPKLEYWLKQLGTYLFVLLLMKMAVLLLFGLFPFLFDVGSWILGLFGSHKDIQVLFSMALFPLAMNVLQFWLIDSLLRHNPHTSAYSKLNQSGEGDHDEEGFGSHSDRRSSDSHYRDRYSGSTSNVWESNGESSSGAPHIIGVDVDAEEDQHGESRGDSAQNGPRRRALSPLPQTTPLATVDQPYDFGLASRSSRPPSDSPTEAKPKQHSHIEQMRREASRTLSDPGSDDNDDSTVSPLTNSISNLRAPLKRSESHNLQNVSTAQQHPK